jgi:mRNA-degrading endonuclease RelE of RelBE toxin-antitoxin system
MFATGLLQLYYMDYMDYRLIISILLPEMIVYIVIFLSDMLEVALTLR